MMIRDSVLYVTLDGMLQFNHVSPADRCNPSSLVLILFSAAEPVWPEGDFPQRTCIQGQKSPDTDSRIKRKRARRPEP